MFQKLEVKSSVSTSSKQSERPENKTVDYYSVNDKLETSKFIESPIK